jgi:menaquinol-cytochrome c reductase iron-sulfur subunit
MAVTESKGTVSAAADLDLAEKDPTYTRRQFLKWGIYAVGGAVTVVIGVPTVLYFINPALQGSDASKLLVKLGPVGNFANQTNPKAVSQEYTYKDTFKDVTGTKQVFVRAKQAGAAAAADFEVLDPTCTHLGCAVSFNPSNAPANAKDKFYCPCHGSVFEKDGKYAAGPAPKGLFHYTPELTDDGQLAINVAEYKG